MITLYDYFRSSACFRVRIALEIKNIAYQKETIHLIDNGGEQFSPQYSTLNTQQLVPTLDHNNQLLTQSLAIIEYLNDLYPTPPLLPIDPYEKACVRAFALSIASDIHPLNNLRILNFLEKNLGVTQTDKMRWYHHWIEKGFTALESQLNKEKHTTPFCFGNEPSLADICLIPQWYNAKRFNCNLTPYPTLNRIYVYCEKLPAFAAAFPEETVT